MAIELTSPAFSEGKPIPAKYAYAKQNVSPPLAWSGLPEATKSLALICDDPDAPRPKPWVHWVIYNLPASATGLKQDLPKAQRLADPAGAVQGRTDYGEIGWGGPAPPSGMHRYFFRLYALDVAPDLKSGLDREGLLRAMKGHVLAEGQLMGTYAHV